MPDLVTDPPVRLSSPPRHAHKPNGNRPCCQNRHKEQGRRLQCLVRLVDAYHPRDTKLIFQHTKSVSPECFLPFHIDLATIG